MNGSVDLVIRNGKIVTPSGIILGGVGINEGKIAVVSSDSLLPKASRVIDAGGKIVIPGLIDPHVHLGSHPPIGIGTDFKTETECAAHGGVTTIMVFLFSRRSHAPTIEEYTRQGEENSMTDFTFHAGIQTEEQLHEMRELFTRGVTSYKFFYDGARTRSQTDSARLYAAFETIGQLGSPAIGLVHAEDMDIIELMTKRLQEQGRSDLAAWSEARPNISEAMRVNNAALIAKELGAQLYLVHVSAEESVELAAFHKARGTKMFVETSPHYLILTKHMHDKLGIKGKIMAPLRGPEDAEQLWKGLNAGTIECIGTDHCNHTQEEKLEGGNLWSAQGSWPGMETTLPIMFSEGVHRGRISLETLVKVCSENTARAFGLYPRKGALVVGADADLVVVDPRKEMEITASQMHSRSDWNIFEGLKVKGAPVLTLARGTLLMENGTTFGKPGTGRYLQREAFP